MKNLSLLSVAFLLLQFSSFAQTYVSGDVYGTWLLNNSPYYIQGDIAIPNDSTLIIEPGVIIEFLGYYSLDVQGRLLAIGNESNKILFTSHDTTGYYNPDTTLGGWNGIEFINTPISNDTSRLDYCIVRYGKAVGSNPLDNSGGAIFVQNYSKLVISNSLIVNNSAGGTDSPSGGGISLHFANIIFSSNVISNNYAWDGGGIQVWECDPIFHDNSFTNNTAGQSGGGIWIGGFSNPDFNGDNVSNNIAGIDGGGIICWQGSNSILDSVNIDNNVAQNGGGATFIECEAQINWCSIKNNYSSGSGGGINAYLSNLQINNTDFEGDTSSIFGGAIETNNSTLTINDCTFRDNGTVIRGGGIHATFGNINIINTIFERDTSNIFGGAIGAENSEMLLFNCNFIDNSARTLGGAIHSDLSTINIINSTFKRDTTGGSGGAVFNWLCQTQIINCEFSENTAFNGGAISSSNSSISIDSCVFYQNKSQNQGAAIEFVADTSNFTSTCILDITHSRFEENSSLARCGVALIEQYNSNELLANLRIDNCEFINNNALRVGAIRISSIKDFSISNSKFTGNSVDLHTASCTFAGNSNGRVYNTIFSKNIANNGSSGGAGISINSKVDFMNCTFANNRSSSGGAIHLRAGGEVILTNTIMWDNLPDQISLNAVNDTSACSLYANYNNIQYGIDSVHILDSVSVINWGVGNIDAEPLFTDTLNSDFHLQELSPCLAAGIDSLQVNGAWYYAPLSDIEGNPRPNPSGTSPDMGAYESQFPVKVGEQNLSSPKKYYLFQNYPNPFNPSTKIKFSIPQLSTVVIKVLDILGNEIETLIDEEKQTGTYELSWYVEGLPSGIYFYQIRTGSFTDTKKMILLK